MKNLKFVLIAVFSLVLLSATSCKKEKAPQPAPVVTTPAPVLTGNIVGSWKYVQSQELYPDGTTSSSIYHEETDSVVTKADGTCITYITFLSTHSIFPGTYSRFQTDSVAFVNPTYVSNRSKITTLSTTDLVLQTPDPGSGIGFRKIVTYIRQ